MAVKPRQRRIAIGLGARDVVNAIAAFLYDLAALIEPVVG